MICRFNNIDDIYSLCDATRKNGMMDKDEYLKQDTNAQRI